MHDLYTSASDEHPCDIVSEVSWSVLSQANSGGVSDTTRVAWDAVYVSIGDCAVTRRLIIILDPCVMDRPSVARSVDGWVGRNLQRMNR